MKRPPRRRQALLILDMISRFDFRDGNRTLRAASRIAPRIARLRERAHRAGVPVIYVNDMGGGWESDQRAFIEGCKAGKAGALVRRLAPAPGDCFMFKPRHSAFYASALAHLLEQLHTTDIVVTGITSHQCVLFTAMDAYVRGYRLTVPRDCIGAPEPAQTRHALFILEKALDARLRVAGTVRFG